MNFNRRTWNISIVTARCLCTKSDKYKKALINLINSRDYWEKNRIDK